MTRRISALCSGRLADAVQARADEEGVTVSDVVREALAAHLQRSGHLTRFYPQAVAVIEPPAKRPTARAKRGQFQTPVVFPLGVEPSVKRPTARAEPALCLLCGTYRQNAAGLCQCLSATIL